MTKTARNCGTCHHGASVGPDSIACHRYPPTITKTEGNEVTTYFPLLSKNAWCGEWKVGSIPKRD